MDNGFNSQYFASFHDFLKKTVVTPLTSDGREYIFAHKDMADVTCRPNKRGNAFLDLKSLLYFAETYGTKEKSIVFYDDSSCRLYLDEVWRENLSTFQFLSSKAVGRWLKKTYNQKEFVDLLECWGAEEVSTFQEDKRTITDITLTAYELSLAQNISYTSKIKDFNNVLLRFEIKEEPGSTNSRAKTLPKNWTLKIPIFEGEEPILVEARLNITIPKAADESPLFGFECLKYDSYKEKAIALIVERIKSRLSGWQVLYAK